MYEGVGLVCLCFKFMANENFDSNRLRALLHFAARVFTAGTADPPPTCSGAVLELTYALQATSTVPVGNL